MNKVGKLGKDSGIYCGRGGKQHYNPLGNQFKIGLHGNRRECCDQYESWLREKVKNENIKILQKFAEIKEDSVLLCFCRRLGEEKTEKNECHCDRIWVVWGELRELYIKLSKVFTGL